MEACGGGVVVCGGGVVVCGGGVVGCGGGCSGVCVSVKGSICSCWICS